MFVVDFCPYVEEVDIFPKNWNLFMVLEFMSR